MVEALALGSVSGALLARREKVALWVAAIATFVLFEKLIGPGRRMGRWLSGGALIGAGVFLLVARYGGIWLTSIG